LLGRRRGLLGRRLIPRPLGRGIRDEGSDPWRPVRPRHDAGHNQNPEKGEKPKPSMPPLGLGLGRGWWPAFRGTPCAFAGRSLSTGTQRFRTYRFRTRGLRTGRVGAGLLRFRSAGGACHGRCWFSRLGGRPRRSGVRRSDTRRDDRTRFLRVFRLRGRFKLWRFRLRRFRLWRFRLWRLGRSRFRRLCGCGRSGWRGSSRSAARSR
jgi:hypothetical protein